MSKNQKTKTSMNMSMKHEGKFRVKDYEIVPVNINVKGFMIAEDATRIFDQIVKSVECTDNLLAKPIDTKKPKDNQYAWVEIDDSGDLEMARYRADGDKWYDFAIHPESLEGNRVRVHQLIKTPKL